MASTGTLQNAALSVKDSAQSMNTALHNEVYGGGWNDDVGMSYLSYTASLLGMADGFCNCANSVKQIDSQLESVKESADRARLNSLKTAVNKL